MGAHTPTVPFERAEFVRADANYSILNRIVKATQVDTILHTFMVTNSARLSSRALHETNVIGTMNLLAAAGASGSSVRHIVVKSSTLVYGSSARDPNTFHEDTPRAGPPRHDVERTLLEAEALVRDFSEDNPGTLITVLRFANVLGPHLTHRHQPEPVATLVPRHLRLRPAACSSSRKMTSCGRSSMSPVAASRACTTWRERGACPGARWPTSAAPIVSRSLPTVPSGSARWHASSISRPSSRISCATGAASTPAGWPPRASPTGPPVSERSRASSRSSGYAAPRAGPDRRTPMNTTSNSSSGIHHRCSGAPRA